MLSWFLKLSTSERCAATAIVDDTAFVEFYLDILRLESESRCVGFHARFSQERLNNLFETCKIKSNRNVVHWRDEIESLPEPRASDDESDYDEFDDPFYSVSIRPLPDESILKHCSSEFHGGGGNATTENVPLNMNRLLLQDTVNLVCTTALRNAATRLFQSELATHYHISDSLHRYVVIGSSDLKSNDSMFLLSGALDNGSQFLSTLQKLSNSGVFTSNVTSSSGVVANASTGTDYPLPHWTVDLMPCPSYIVLVARIEMAIRAAYLAVHAKGISLRVDNDDNDNDVVDVVDVVDAVNMDEDVMVGRVSSWSTNNCSQAQSSHHCIRSADLSSSKLFVLPAASAILNIVCTSEELKILWRKMDQDAKKSILGTQIIQLFNLIIHLFIHLLICSFIYILFLYCMIALVVD